MSKTPSAKVRPPSKISDVIILPAPNKEPVGAKQARKDEPSDR